MRTLVDLKPEQIEGLDEMARERKQSRAALIRAAVDRYLAEERPRAPIDEAFGLWGPGEPDGLEYQTRLRDEW